MNPAHQVEKMVDRLIEVFAAPIITWPGFEDVVPEWMKKQAIVERMIQHMQGNYDEGTDIEALIYLHTASLARPFNEEWGRIYMHLFKKYAWDKVKDNPAFSFLEGIELDEREKSLLADLKRWIKRTQRKHLQEKRNAGKAPAQL